MIAIILDSPCAYLAKETTSILGAPLGSGTVLSHLVELTSHVGIHTVRILTPVDADASYVENLAATACGMAEPCDRRELPAILSKLEPSDWVLVLHPRCWPVRGLDLSQFTQEQSRAFGAWFAVPVGMTRERILDAVQKIMGRYPQAKMREINHNAPSWCDPGHPMVEIIQKNVRQLQGFEPKPVVSLGATDTRLWRYANVPAYVYGPSPSGMGSSDEHVPIDVFLHIVRTHALSAWDYLSRG